jgi:hypothetical protein
MTTPANPAPQPTLAALAGLAARWEKKRRRLQGDVTKARRRRALAVTLAEKIECIRAIEQAERELWEHKINYWDLTSQGAEVIRGTA